MKKLFLVLIIGIFLINNVSALPTEYDDLTKNIIQILQALIIFSGAWLVMMTTKRFYVGDLTLGDFIIIMIQVGLGLIALVFLGPIAIKYLISVIV